MATEYRRLAGQLLIHEFLARCRLGDVFDTEFEFLRIIGAHRHTIWSNTPFVLRRTFKLIDYFCLNFP